MQYYILSTTNNTSPTATDDRIKVAISRHQAGNLIGAMRLLDKCGLNSGNVKLIAQVATIADKPDVTLLQA